LRRTGADHSGGGCGFIIAACQEFRFESRRTDRTFELLEGAINWEDRKRKMKKRSEN
jgi:hypothetical protein